MSLFFSPVIVVLNYFLICQFDSFPVDFLLWRMRTVVFTPFHLYLPPTLPYNVSLCLICSDYPNTICIESTVQVSHVGGRDTMTQLLTSIKASQGLYQHKLSQKPSWALKPQGQKPVSCYMFYKRGDSWESGNPSRSNGNSAASHMITSWSPSCPASKSAPC